jgi:hypothetical protein
MAARDPDRQRQQPTSADDFGSGVRRGGHQFGPDHLCKQAQRFTLGQHVERHPASARQRRERRPTGDDHDNPGGAREQRQDLLDTARVVEHQQ